MHFPLMAERTRYLKENPKGVSEMCKIIEDMRKEEHAEGRMNERIENIRNLAKNMKLSIEQAMSVLEVPEDERQKYKDLLEHEAPKEWDFGAKTIATGEAVCMPRLFFCAFFENTILFVQNMNNLLKTCEEIW